MFLVDGGPYGEFDVPAVRAFVRVFAPRRGEIVVDVEALDLDAAAPPREAARRPAEGAPRRRSGPRRKTRDRGRTGRRPPPPDRPDMTLEIDVLTLFPAMLEAPLAESIPGRIQERGIVTIRAHDLREWGIGRHRSVDDAPYGGGAGMVMRPEPVAAALDALRRRDDSLVILLDPAGEVFRQARARDLASRPHLVLVCARYEGVDERDPRRSSTSSSRSATTC